MKIKVEREKLIRAGFVILLAFLLIHLFIYPHWENLMAVRSSYRAGSKLLETRKIEMEKLQVLMDIREEWKDKLADFESRIIKEEDVNTFLQTLTQLAENTRNRLLLINPMERRGPGKTGLQKMNVELTLVGKFPTILDFVQKLEADGKMLDIADIKIVRQENESQDLKASFLISLFILATAH